MRLRWRRRGSSRWRSSAPRRVALPAAADPERAAARSVDRDSRSSRPVGIPGDPILSVGVAASILAVGGFLLLLREAFHGQVVLRRSRHWWWRRTGCCSVCRCCLARRVYASTAGSRASTAGPVRATPHIRPTRCRSSAARLGQHPRGLRTGVVLAVGVALHLARAHGRRAGEASDDGAAREPRDLRRDRLDVHSPLAESLPPSRWWRSARTRWWSSARSRGPQLQESGARELSEAADKPSHGLGSVLDLLVATSIQRRALVRYDWTVPIATLKAEPRR